jgi:hypothetical protein
VTDNHTILRADQYFAIVPEWLLFGDVSDRAVRIYGLLARRAGETGQAHPGRSWLAEQTKSSKASVDRAIRELEEAGAVCRRRRRHPDGDFDFTLYTVHTTPCAGCVDDDGDPLVLPFTADPPSSPVTTGSLTGEATGGLTGDEGVASPVSANREPSYTKPSTTTAADSVVTGDDDDEVDEPDRPEPPNLRLARHWAHLKGIPFESARRHLVGSVTAAVTALAIDGVTVDEAFLDHAHRLGIKVPGGWWIAAAAQTNGPSRPADCDHCGSRGIVVVLDDGRHVPVDHDDAWQSDYTKRCVCTGGDAA